MEQHFAYVQRLFDDDPARTTGVGHSKLRPFSVEHLFSPYGALH